MEKQQLEFFKSLGKSIARGVPQLATGFVDLAALPFTMSGLLENDKVFGSTAYLTKKGLLPKPQTGLLNQGTELVTSMLNPASAAKGIGLLGLGTVKNIAMQKKAIDRFGITKNPNETGFILDDGRRLDFSGRHYAPEYKKKGLIQSEDYLANNRTVDHGDISEIVKSGELDWGNFINESGAIRYRPNVGASFVDTNKPSIKQMETVVNDFKKSGEPLYLDIDSVDGFNQASKEFINPDIFSVLKWINKKYPKSREAIYLGKKVPLEEMFKIPKPKLTLVPK